MEFYMQSGKHTPEALHMHAMMGVQPKNVISSLSLRVEIWARQRTPEQ